MLDGVTGLKIGGRDVTELVDAMLKLSDADYRTRLGRQARIFAEARRVDRALHRDLRRRRLPAAREG